jgi:hypothetical protein
MFVATLRVDPEEARARACVARGGRAYRELRRLISVCRSGQRLRSRRSLRGPPACVARGGRAYRERRKPFFVCRSGLRLAIAKIPEEARRRACFLRAGSRIHLTAHLQPLSLAMGSRIHRRGDAERRDSAAKRRPRTRDPAAGLPPPCGISNPPDGPPAAPLARHGIAKSTVGAMRSGASAPRSVDLPCDRAQSP